jgi:hypothetical protein
MKPGQLSKPLADQLREVAYKIVPSKGANRHDRRKAKALARKEMERASLRETSEDKELLDRLGPLSAG